MGVRVCEQFVECPSHTYPYYIRQRYDPIWGSHTEVKKLDVLPRVSLKSRRAICSGPGFILYIMEENRTYLSAGRSKVPHPSGPYGRRGFRYL